MDTLITESRVNVSPESILAGDKQCYLIYLAEYGLYVL